jgi:hypothetical protein
MKTTLKTLAAASVLAVATLGTAQADGSRGYGYGHVTAQPGYAYGHGVRQHPLAGLREINERQAEQRARIEHGFHRGAITRWEFRRLMAEQHDIQAMERAFVSDGFLSPRERAELHRRLDIASSHIFHEAHDRERRYR